MTTYAFTGHRPPRLGGYAPAAHKRVVDFAVATLHDLKPVKVIAGMAQGWDQAVAEAAIKLGVPYVAALPFEVFGSRWPSEARDHLKALLAKAADVHICWPSGLANYGFLMQNRNEWMVQNCDKLAALWDGGPGGTANCVMYAKGTLREIVDLWPDWQKLPKTDFVVPSVEDVPDGYRSIQAIIGESLKAFHVEYYSLTLWVPKRFVVRDQEGQLWASDWAITSAKRYRTAN